MFISAVQKCQSAVCTHRPCTHICTQLYVHVSLPRTHPPSLTPRSSWSTESSSLCYGQHPTNCFIHGSVYTSMLRSPSSYPLLPPVCPQVHSLYLRLYHCHQHHLSRFSLYIYVNIILVFLTFSMTDSGFIHITYSQFQEDNHLEWPDCTAGHWLGASTLPRMPCVLYHFIFLTTCSLHTLTSKGI